MSPKEKAIELIEKFRLNVTDYEGSGMNIFKAKQCTLIAVEEVINSMTVATSVYLPFWQEVKTEIEKL